MNVSRKTAIGFALWCAWVVVAAYPWLWQRRDVFAVWLEVLHGLVAALWFWMLLTVLGWGIARRWFFAERGNEDGECRDTGTGELAAQLLIAAGIGLGFYAAIVLVFGIVIGVSKPLFLVLHGGLVVLGGRNWLTVGKQVSVLVSRWRTRGWTRWEARHAVLLFLVLGSILPFALTPNLNPDTLRYHFGLTRLYETAGCIYPMPNFAESNISLNWQMLYLGILMVAGEMAAQLFNWLALPLSLLVIALASGSAARWFTCWVLVCTPFLLAESALVNNDLGVVFFCALMWLAIRSRGVKQEWFLAGLFGGMAFGTKYPSLLAVIGLAGGGLFGGSGTVRARARSVARFVAGVAVGYAPWFIRNLAWTGDPVYPALSRWLPWASASGQWVVDHYSRELMTYGGGMTGWARWLMAPWRVTLAQEPFFESELGLVVWAVLPLVLWGGLKTALGRTTAIATVIFGLLWAAGPQVTRFLAAGLPAFALAAAEGWRSLASQGLRKGMAMVLGGLLMVNLWITWLVLAPMSNPLGFFLNRFSRDVYLVERSPAYRTAFWLNHNACAGKKVLLMGVDDNWFFQNLAGVSGPFDQKWIVRQANEVKSPGELAHRLQEAGIGFICLDRRRVEALEKQFGYLGGGNTESRQRLFKFLEENTETIRRDGGCELRRLRRPQQPF